MIGAFRMTYKISAEKEIYLLFDGDRLQPTAVVGATELSDMDNIEVYVK